MRPSAQGIWKESVTHRLPGRRRGPPTFSGSLIQSLSPDYSRRASRDSAGASTRSNSIRVMRRCSVAPTSWRPHLMPSRRDPPRANGRCCRQKEEAMGPGRLRTRSRSSRAPPAGPGAQPAGAAGSRGGADIIRRRSVCTGGHRRVPDGQQGGPQPRRSPRSKPPAGRIEGPYCRRSPILAGPARRGRRWGRALRVAWTCGRQRPVSRRMRAADPDDRGSVGTK